MEISENKGLPMTTFLSSLAQLCPCPCPFPPFLDSDYASYKKDDLQPKEVELKTEQEAKALLSNEACKNQAVRSRLIFATALAAHKMEKTQAVASSTSVFQGHDDTPKKNESFIIEINDDSSFDSTKTEPAQSLSRRSSCGSLGSGCGSEDSWINVSTSV